MSDVVLKKTVSIGNIRGLHARAAAAFVKIADRYKSMVTVEKGDNRVSGKSIMGLMMLTASKGARVTICCQGTDAKEALESLVSLVHEKFYED